METFLCDLTSEMTHARGLQHTYSGDRRVNFQFGTQQQKEKYIAPLAAADTLGCISRIEPNAGYGVASLQTKAVKNGDCYIPNKLYSIGSGKGGHLFRNTPT